MISRKILVCLFLMTLIPLSSSALPPPSPAGGGMLRLDENHDFVATIKAWSPDEQFKGLTAEAWIYFEEPPEWNTFWVIIGQEGRFSFILHGNDLNGGKTLGASGNGDGVNGPKAISGGAPVPQGEWVHVVAIYDAGAGTRVNAKGINRCCPGGHLIKSGKPLHIGGIYEQNRWVGSSVKLQGYIDEVRISKVVRYAKPGWEVPKGPFRVDKDTISLWHFDEAQGSSRFKDASGNNNDLWRSGVLAVEAERKLTTTWGRLKR